MIVYASYILVRSVPLTSWLIKSGNFDNEKQCNEKFRVIKLSQECEQCILVCVAYLTSLLHHKKS